MPRIKTKFQLSAGGVIFRESEGIEVALIATKGGEVWGLPKGLVERERNEPLEEAALREVQEETGLFGRVLERIDKIEYWYRWEEDNEPVRYHKIVYFFLIEHQGGDVRNHDFEVDEVRWFALAEAERVASYESEREILHKTGELLAKRRQKRNYRR
ncbi:MAG: NUDIX domain-containing protein [Anaerolineae bacterium]